MEQSKNAYYKSPVAPMSSFFWMCCKERQKKGHLALNNQKHSLIDGDLYFSAIFILVVRPQIECGLKCPEFLAMFVVMIIVESPPHNLPEPFYFFFPFISFVETW